MDGWMHWGTQPWTGKLPRWPAPLWLWHLFFAMKETRCCRYSVARLQWSTGHSVQACFIMLQPMATSLISEPFCDHAVGQCEPWTGMSCVFTAVGRVINLWWWWGAVSVSKCPTSTPRLEDINIHCTLVEWKMGAVCTSLVFRLRADFLTPSLYMSLTSFKPNCSEIWGSVMKLWSARLTQCPRGSNEAVTLTELVYWREIVLR